MTRRLVDLLVLLELFADYQVELVQVCLQRQFALFLRDGRQSNGDRCGFFSRLGQLAIFFS